VKKREGKGGEGKGREGKGREGKGGEGRGREGSLGQPAEGTIVIMTTAQPVNRPRLFASDEFRTS